MGICINMGSDPTITGRDADLGDELRMEFPGLFRKASRAKPLLVREDDIDDSDGLRGPAFVGGLTSMELRLLTKRRGR